MWTKTYGGIASDYGYSVQQTVDGGYIITGSTFSYGAGNEDIWLIKTDVDGDTLWTRTYGGVSSDEAYAVQQTADGGYIIAGYTYSIGSGGMYLVKTDSLGDSIWTRPYPGPQNGAKGKSVQQTSDGGYVMVGYADFFQNMDVGLVKTDSTGHPLLWLYYGGPYGDYGNAVRQTIDSGYVIVGTTFSFGPYTPDQSNVWLIKTNSFGDTLWTKTYGGASHETGESVQQTGDGGYIIAGTVMSGDYNCYLVKTDTHGDTIWTRTFPGSGGYAVQLTSDGHYTVAGSRNGDVLLMKVTLSGDTLWTRTYGSIEADIGASFQETIDSGYIIAGTTWSGAGQSDVYLVKLESDTFDIAETKMTHIHGHDVGTTIINGPLQLPRSGAYRIFDITGREIHTCNPAPGIYFLTVNGQVEQKVIKIK